MPCHGDRDPFIAGRFSIVSIFFSKNCSCHSDLCT
jgi:hypothetical protein